MARPNRYGVRGLTKRGDRLRNRPPLQAPRDERVSAHPRGAARGDEERRGEAESGRSPRRGNGRDLPDPGRGRRGRQEAPGAAQSPGRVHQAHGRRAAADGRLPGVPRAHPQARDAGQAPRRPRAPRPRAPQGHAQGGWGRPCGDESRSRDVAPCVRSLGRVGLARRWHRSAPAQGEEAGRAPRARP